jgi:hypothetical protein
MKHRLDQIAVIAATRNLSGPPVFRKSNKRPNQLIIVGGAWQAIQNACGSPRSVGYFGGWPISQCQNAFEASFIMVMPLLRIGSK